MSCSASFLTYLQSASEHTDHQHGHGQVIGKHIPPWLQHPEGRLLLRELPELCHRNHVSEKREVTGDFWLCSLGAPCPDLLYPLGVCS